MRVLITGATGFAGGHLAEHCAGEGDEVVGLARGDGAELRVDLEDAAATRQAIASAAADAVVHLAALASVSRAWEQPGETLRANLVTTANVLEAVRSECPEARVLIACSGEEYGPPERLPVDEEHPLRPQNPYAASKAAADLLAGMYADARGLDVLRMRAFNHTGPGQSDDYVVSAFARQIAEAEQRGDSAAVVETGNLAPRRDFTDVRDVVRAYRLALGSCAPGVYNVCSGRSVAGTDILAGLARHARIEIQQRTAPGRVRSHDVMDITGSHEKLRASTGWAPEVPFEDTLADVLDWWRERVAG